MGLVKRVSGSLGAVFPGVWSSVTLGKSLRDNGEVHARMKAILGCTPGELVRELAAINVYSRRMPCASAALGLSDCADGG